MINQLFRILPNRDLMINILYIYGINGFNDKSTFTKNDLLKINTLDNLTKYIDELNKIYIPCKSKIYLNNITLNKSITILRQLLKTQNYKIISNDKYINNHKCTLYHIAPIIKKDNKIVINFE